MDNRDPASLSPAESRRLVHELRVHQIELEMQNEELRRAQVELDDARARYFDLYDLAPVGYLTLDEGGAVLEANLRAASLLGTPRSALILRSLTSFIAPADQDLFYRRRQELVRTGRPMQCELRLLRAGRGEFWAQVEANLMQGPPETPRVCRCTVIDVTDRKEAETLLRRSKEELEESSRSLQEAMERAQTLSRLTEQASEAKGRYLASISHEIRTPLNGLLGMIDLLRETALSDEQREYVALAHATGEGLRRIIDDVLDFSKLEAGKLDIEEESFDPRALLELVVVLLGLRARQKGLRLEWRADDSVPAVLRGDPGRIRQVLLNLVDNAIKYTDGGSVAIAVTGRSLGPDRIEARFEVQDTGAGVPPDKVSVLFNPFEQGEREIARRSGGTGLGLAISKRLVELMGGMIGYAGREEAGATFWFTLPLGRPDTRAAAAVGWEAGVEELPATGPAARTGDGSVLLVEDDADNRFVALRMLSRLGVRADVAVNGREAIRALESARYDLVLMDLQMPEMGGLEATRAIRSRSTGALDPEVPIVALTAHNMQGDRERSLAAGVNDHLGKPIDRSALATLLRKWLGHSGRI